MTIHLSYYLTMASFCYFESLFCRAWHHKGLHKCCSEFLSQVIFVFLLFLGMVMYANEVETKEK